MKKAIPLHIKMFVTYEKYNEWVEAYFCIFWTFTCKNSFYWITFLQVSRQIELVACFVECQRSYTSNPTKSMQVLI